jgi:thiol-disulfide isomerase/thioredoxin
LLSAVASSATAGGPTPTLTPPVKADAAPLTLISSIANFNSILQQHPAVVVNFTNTPSCPPCRVIKPIYEALSADFAALYGAKGARFLEVELGIGEGRDIAGRHGVSATPTFMFFREGKKVDELRGASKRELEVKIEAFLEDVWPRHPHRKVYLPQLEGLPISPITSANVPNFGALVGKLESFGVGGADLETIRSRVIPLLDGTSGQGSQSGTDVKSVYAAWSDVSGRLVADLKPEETFPVIDLWRVGLLNPRIAAAIALQLNGSAADPITPILTLASKVLQQKGASTPKPFLLTTLRLLTNLLAALPIANLLLAHSTDVLIGIVVESLLHADSGVRSAAAGVAYNLSGVRHRDAKDTGRAAEDGEEREWEVELVSALVEGIGREADEDVGESMVTDAEGSRLTRSASLACVPRIVSLPGARI